MPKHLDCVKHGHNGVCENVCICSLDTGRCSKRENKEPYVLVYEEDIG